MKIKSVLNIFREIRYMKSVLKAYSDRLSAGKYVLFDGFRAMALNDSQTLTHAHSYFDKPGINPRMASVARKLNKMGYYTNKNKRSTAEYEAFYTANNYDKCREVKLFSFRNQKILTICTSASEAEKQISQYKLYSKAYSMPTVKKNESYPNAFEISMISLKDFPGNVLALNSISQSTVRFYPATNNLARMPARELIKHVYNNSEIDLLLGELCSKIDPSVLDLEIPLCVQHGDLSKDNLLYGECDGKIDFWWIDWEHAKERPFFYDYFFYIINSALYYDVGAYEYYMNGGADQDMEMFFKHFGLSFDKEKRKDYFLIFAVYFLKERVCDFGRVAALKKYCEFIQTH